MEGRVRPCPLPPAVGGAEDGPPPPLLGVGEAPIPELVAAVLEIAVLANGTGWFLKFSPIKAVSIVTVSTILLSLGEQDNSHVNVVQTSGVSGSDWVPSRLGDSDKLTTFGRSLLSSLVVLSAGLDKEAGEAERRTVCAGLSGSAVDRRRGEDDTPS